MTSSEKSLNNILTELQNELRVPKSHKNKFGDYFFRNAEDIYNSVKPLLQKYELNMTMTDELIEISGDVFIAAKCVISNDKETRETTGFAKIDFSKKKMDASQQTGSASSYARKYALNGMFLIDDMKDSDTNEYNKEMKERERKAAEEENNKPTVEELKQFKDFLASEGIDEKFVLQAYKIDKLENISMQRIKIFSDINNLETIKENYKKWLNAREAVNE